MPRCASAIDARRPVHQKKSESIQDKKRRAGFVPNGLRRCQLRQRGRLANAAMARQYYGEALLAMQEVADGGKKRTVLPLSQRGPH